MVPTSNPPRLAPELLAPAGNMDCVRAAVENGADAIYFGLDCGFNARARATNFSDQDLTQILDFVHQRGVHGYVTLNTLAYSNELPEVERLIRMLSDRGADAILVQDIGVARLAREICPELPLHASTQMTMTSAETIVLAEELGMERVVVARELSINEIRAIRSKTTMPIETFIHGALYFVQRVWPIVEEVGHGGVLGAAHYRAAQGDHLADALRQFAGHFTGDRPGDLSGAPGGASDVDRPCFEGRERCLHTIPRKKCSDLPWKQFLLLIWGK